MEALLLALELRRKYNQMDLEESVKEFEEYTSQKVPQEAIDEFKFCGLNNVDFFTSDWLNRYNLYNLLQWSSESKPWIVTPGVQNNNSIH